MTQERIAVIGRGLIGSAAAKYLAQAGGDVTLIGPDEPKDLARHQGVFASHYDEGRITRRLDPHPFWSRVSRSSIARYRDIEAASGVPFFSEVGSVIAGQEGGEMMRNVAQVAKDAALKAEWLDSSAFTARFPYLRLQPGDIAAYEAHQAGHISPRRLVQAQGILAKAHGARIIAQEVLGLDEANGQTVLRIGDEVLRFDRALVAAGAFCRQLLGEAAQDVTPYKRTAAFFRLGAPEAERLQNMPTLIHKTDADDPYILPPVRYPDGQVYLKLGGDPQDLPALEAGELAGWYRSGGSAEVGAYLRDVLLRRIPDLGYEAMHVTACATTFTPEDLPRIGPVSSHIFAAGPGCGRGAKCSDELGRMAAEAVLRGAKVEIAA